MSELVTSGGNGHAITEAPADFLSRMACDPNVDAQKLEVLSRVYINTMEKQRQWMREDAAERARLAYFEAKPAMQAELPSVNRDGYNDQTKSNFTTFGPMWAACKPVWTKHGFTVDFNATDTAAGEIEVILRLTHAAGYTETFTSFTAPPDTTGPKGGVNKTIIQGKQSSVTYIQTRLLQRALGIAASEDPTEDDGKDNPRDTGYRPHTQPTGMRQEVRRGPAPPPPRPDGPQRPWVVTLERKLDALSKDGLRWSRAVQHAFSVVPTVEDFTELEALIWPKTEDQEMPPDVRTEIRVAIGAARKRLAVDTSSEQQNPNPETESQRRPKFDYPVYDAFGETDGEAFTDPERWAREFMVFWDATASDDDKRNLLHHNTEAHAHAREWPAVAGELAAAELPPDDGGPSGATGPAFPLVMEAVRPISVRGDQKDWKGWVRALKDDLATLPDPADLGPWIEAQREVLTEAPLPERVLAIKAIVAACAGYGMATPDWLAGLLHESEPTDEHWVEKQLAKLQAIGNDLAGRAAFNSLIKELRPKMAGLQTRDRGLFNRLNHAFTAKNSAIPGAAA
jgi:hypothetical protein